MNLLSSMRQRIIAAARCCGTRIAQVALAACALQLVACTVVPVNPDLPAPGYEPRQISNAQRPVLGLVLGSGASRGFAHIGVIQELEDNGIVPDVIVGTSSGALVGALYAGGFGGRELERIAGAMREDDVRDLMLPGRGFVRGNALQAFVNRQLQSRSIEQLDKPFAAVATDLEDGLPAVFNRGNVGIAVRASSSVPGVFEPVRLAGRDYVDGGLVSPVPIRTARDLGAETVIAVDVSRKPEKGALLEGILSILNQTIAIMGRYIAEREVGNADVLIQPDLQEMSRFDFEQTSLAIQAGREAARRAMPDIRQALQRSALAKARRSRSRP